MRKSIFQAPLVLVALFLTATANADELTAGALLQGNTHPASLEGAKIVGPGADLIFELAEDAQFVALGEELDDDEIEWATAYLENLGFPYAEVVAVQDWEEAEAAAQNPDWNSAWWEAEEQQRPPPLPLPAPAQQVIKGRNGKATRLSYAPRNFHPVSGH